jgi:hypothetical protein
MKNNIFGIVTILCIGFLSSCTKGLLDKEPLDKYSDATVWNDPNLAEAFINDQYKVLPNLQWYDKVRGIYEFGPFIMNHRFKSPSNTLLSIQ